ncbi:hypothetical protein BH23PAT2_BH23PAT2_00530 [soil metagenome]
MGNKILTLSVIIPTFNEEGYIRDCLEAIACQSDMPDEVIVVDNNSTDRTVRIARSFDFVKVIHEPKQGLIHARNAGFAAATGDILGRIDADSVITTDWVKRVKETFMDDSIDAISGPGYLTLIPSMKYESLLWTKLYFIGALAYNRVRVLWGANMALRDRAWKDIKHLTEQEDSRVHEDQDVSMCLNLSGYRIAYDKNLIIRTDATRFWDISKLFLYYNKSVLTNIRMNRLQEERGLCVTRDVSLISAVGYLFLCYPSMFVFLSLAALYGMCKKIQTTARLVVSKQEF